MRYKKYPSYKDSGVEWLGEIPEEWKIRKFKYLFQIRKRISGELGFNILSITQNGIKIKDIKSGSGQLSSDYSKYQFVYKDDYAMNHMDLLTGFVDLSKYDGVTSPDYRVFSLIENHSNKDYYLYLLQMGYINKIFYPLGQGSSEIGRWRLPTDAFKEFQAPFPPQKEQENIAKYIKSSLNKIDTLIIKQKRLIELLKEKRQALISKAVTRGLDDNVEMKDSGVEWLGEIPKGWNNSTLKFQLINLDFRRIPISASERGDIQGIYPYYGASGIIDFVENYIFDEMTILIGEDGANLLSKSTPLAFIADGKYWVNNHAHILKPKDKLFNFWTYILNNLDLTPSISGSAQPKLTAEALGNLTIVFPKSISERIEIANYLDQKTTQIDTLISKSTKAITLLQEKRTALISSVVTGKIDVRGEYEHT